MTGKLNSTKNFCKYEGVLSIRK